MLMLLLLSKNHSIRKYFRICTVVRMVLKQFFLPLHSHCHSNCCMFREHLDGSSHSHVYSLVSMPKHDDPSRICSNAIKSNHSICDDWTLTGCLYKVRWCPVALNQFTYSNISIMIRLFFWSSLALYSQRRKIFYCSALPSLFCVRAEKVKSSSTFQSKIGFFVVLLTSNINFFGHKISHFNARAMVRTLLKTWKRFFFYFVSCLFIQLLVVREEDEWLDSLFYWYHLRYLMPDEISYKHKKEKQSEREIENDKK